MKIDHLSILTYWTTVPRTLSKVLWTEGVQRSLHRQTERTKCTAGLSKLEDRNSRFSIRWYDGSLLCGSILQ